MTTSRRLTRIRLAALAAFLAVGVAACGNDATGRGPKAEPDSAAGAATVEIALFRFRPGTLTVPMGGTVTWRNDDAVLHTVTAGAPGQATGRFDEALPDKGRTASVTFHQPGNFQYFCARHPEAMRGEVSVVSRGRRPPPRSAAR